MAKPTLREAVVQKLQVVEQRTNIVDIFQEAQSVLEGLTRRDDFFAGYTLKEVIRDRLAQIGYEMDKEDPNYDYPGDKTENDLYTAENRFGERTVQSEYEKLSDLERQVDAAVTRAIALLEAATVEEAEKIAAERTLNGSDPLDAVETA